MSQIKKAAYHIQRFVYRIHDDHLFHLAASLAYTTLLTLVPFLIVIFYTLSLFPFFHGMGDIIQHFMLTYFVSGLTESINHQLKQFLSQMSQLKLINIGALVLLNVLMMHNIVSAFNSIWHTKTRYNFALSSLVNMVILILSPLFFASLLLLGPYIASIQILKAHQFSEHLIQTLKQPLLPLLPHVSAFIVFTLFNWLIPSKKVKLKYAALCGLITMIIFQLAKSAFIIYLKDVHTYQLIYGALATIPLFLFWIYICWTIILFGALLCHLLHAPASSAHTVA